MTVTEIAVILYCCHSGLDPEYSLKGLDSHLRGNDVWIPAYAGMTEKKGYPRTLSFHPRVLSRHPRAPLVIPALSSVIPAEAGIQVPD